MENGKWKVESGRWKMESGKWKAEGGKWKVESGKRKVESGKWKVENGKLRTSFSLSDSLLQRRRGTAVAVDEEVAFSRASCLLRTLFRCTGNLSP